MKTAWQNTTGAAVTINEGGGADEIDDDGFIYSDQNLTRYGFEAATLDPALTLTALAADFEWPGTATNVVPSGAYLTDIQFNPGAVSDRLIVRETADDGVIIFDSGASIDGSPMHKPMHGEFVTPYIKLSECTLTAGFCITFSLKREQ